MNQEEHRQRVIREKLARSLPVASETLQTGFPELDEAMGGGLPRGRIVELFGASGSGKTTIALLVAAELQRGRGAVAWIDADHSFDAAYASQIGVAVERLPVAQPGSAEQAFEIARQLAMSHAIDLLVVDSAALTPEIELQMGIGESGHGTQGRALASGLRKLAPALRSSGTAALFLNQTRVSEQAETSAGGLVIEAICGGEDCRASNGDGASAFPSAEKQDVGTFPRGRSTVGKRRWLIEMPVKWGFERQWA